MSTGWSGPHRDGRPEDLPLPQESPYEPGGSSPGPYLPAPGASGPARSGPPFWLGVVTGLLSPVLLGIPAALLRDTVSLSPLLALLVLVALAVHPRTRRFGLGALLGVGILAIVAAGACLAILALVVDGLG